MQPNLLTHAPGFPAAADLKKLVAAGQPGYGMAAAGADKTTPGAELILRAAGRQDPRPLWVLAWGGANTLAQALVTARATRTPGEVEAIVSRLRVYAIADQDDAGPWLRREFPSLQYIASPSPQNGEEYYLATWTGISGDLFYKNAPGADFSTFTDQWINTNIRSKGPLGKLYPMPCCIHEGDTPSFLGLIDNGLAGAMSPAYGGWGGRYVWRKPRDEPRPFWTQGGDSFAGRDSSRDTVIGIDGKILHVRPSHDLAMAAGVPARLRRAHGLDDQAACRGQPQSARRRERPAGNRTPRARRAGGPAAGARRSGDDGPGRARDRVLVELLP